MLVKKSHRGADLGKGSLTFLAMQASYSVCTVDMSKFSLGSKKSEI